MRTRVTTFDVVLRIRLLEGVEKPSDARLASTLTKSVTGVLLSVSASCSAWDCYWS